MGTKLYFLILGAKPAGRLTEQHDVFLDVASSLGELLPGIKNAWPGTKVHIDSWREVTSVDEYTVSVVPKTAVTEAADLKLFFLNLGGYKAGDMEEYHYKMFCVAKNKAEAIAQAKQTAFYKHTGFKGATSHIDDKYGIDVDDIYEIEDILPAAFKSRYSIQLHKTETAMPEDELHIGYVTLNSLE